ncbi:MAG TPA: hypothetical protein VJI71_02700 [Candidatus Norongarragalinales archaeon]|nr:hypothetical protein [Candidatus Norongarragalinales archaeon]
MKNKSPLRVVFAGSRPTAQECLKVLIGYQSKGEVEIVGVDVLPKNHKTDHRSGFLQHN